MAFVVDQKALKSILVPYNKKNGDRGREKEAPIRERSRSRSRSKSKGKKKVSGAFKQTKRSRSEFVKRNVSKLTPLLQRKSQCLRKLDLAKHGYFDIDKKDAKLSLAETDLKTTQGEVDNLLKEIDLAIGVIKAGLGDKPIRMRLSQKVLFTATVTTGVVANCTIGSGSNRFTPGDATEWSSLAAIFDEVKVMGGHLTVAYGNFVDSTGAGVGSFQMNGAECVPHIGYDLDTNTAPTSVTQVAELAQHAAWAPRIGNAATDTQTSAPNHHFSWHCPSGIVTGSGGSSNIGTNAWTDVGSVTAFNQIFGYIRFYHIGTQVIARNVGAGMVYYDCEFRCRQ